jgi:two-component system, chemotaxis family, chemotaxis protein CheY
MATTVMIVDDSQMVRKQVARTLVAAGYAVVEAQDGREALAQLSSSTPAPSLIVLDVNMPNMGGIEFLQSLRARGHEFVVPPIVMLTTEGEPRLMQEAKALGAKGWIVKPFRPEMLVAAVQKLTQVATKPP